MATRPHWLIGQGPHQLPHSIVYRQFHPSGFGRYQHGNSGLCVEGIGVIGLELGALRQGKTPHFNPLDPFVTRPIPGHNLQPVLSSYQFAGDRPAKGETIE